MPQLSKKFHVVFFSENFTIPFATQCEFAFNGVAGETRATDNIEKIKFDKVA